MIRSFQFDGLTVRADNLEEAKDILREYYLEKLEDRLATGKETDYEKTFYYFPVGEILEEDVPYIYDRKRVGEKDEVASLPTIRAMKYKSYRDKMNNLDSRISFLYHLGTI